MYSMPVAGTSATLYFPNGNSESPIVTGCLRKNGSSCAKTSDTSKRYFGTEHGSEIEMTPGALNIKGGSKKPLSISFDDNVGVTLKSPKKLSLNADDEIIIKTPQKVNIKAESQILAAKTGTENGFSIENEFHFLGDNVIENARDRKTYEPFDDEPKAGKKPEKKKEKKEGFSWWNLAKNVVAGLAVVAVVTVAAVAVAAVAATAAVATAVGVGAALGGTVAVAGQAISDISNDKVSDRSAYMGGGAREAFIGALSGAIFGPLGLEKVLFGKMALGGITNAFESTVRQIIDGKGISFKTTLFDFGIGATIGAVFHGAGKLFKKAAPFIKRGFKKISSTILENVNTAKLALNNMRNTKSVVLGSNLGNASEILSQFNKELKKAKKVIKSGKGAGRRNNVARYGEQKISDELYQKLRKKTPAPEIRDMVNKGINLPMDDFALPGKQITSNLEADHIVSMKKIVKMEGFDKLSYDQQLSILNYDNNFIGLSKIANTSKGSKSYEEWVLYKKGNIEVNPEFRQRMIRIERELQGKIQSKIDDLLK